MLFYLLTNIILIILNEPIDLYNLLVLSITYNINFINLEYIDYSINMYNLKGLNKNMIDKTLLENLKLKIKHPILTCNYKYIYYNYTNNNICNLYFSTYHTFTHSQNNSIRLFQDQYLNINNFILSQNNYYFNTIQFNSKYIVKYFKNELVNDVIIPKIEKMFIENKQSQNDQIMYINNKQFRLNPLFFKMITK